MLRIGAVAFIAIVAAFIGSASAQVSISPELQARMDKEKADRKACRLQICKAFAEPKPDAGPIQCNMIKTWLAGDIQKRILGDHMSWPWGHAQCVADIDLDGGQIAAVMSKPEAVLELKKHTISCKLDEKDATKGSAYEVKLSIAPKVTFKDGKAVKAEMNWSDIEAPTLAKAAIWSATSMDSMLGVLGSGVVKEINLSLYDKCAADGVNISSKN